MDTDNLPINRKESIPVARLLDRMSDDLDLKVMAGFQGIGRPVYISDVNRPGLALSGYLDYFANDRVQVLGNTEIHYMERLSTWELLQRLMNMLAFEIPVFVLSRKLWPRNIFLDTCSQMGIPVLQSSKSTDEVISRTILFLADEFSPETVVHGTAVDCFGVGCLIVGLPGIGKSETALELIERGHRMVADDAVTLRCKGEDTLIAETSPITEHHMEIRGLGIIDIKSVFGAGCVKNSQPIGLVVQLEEWSADAAYDRTGLEEEFVVILGVKVPLIRIPVRPGRNLSIIIEVAALNHRLKELGVYQARAFDEHLTKLMSRNNA